MRKFKPVRFGAALMAMTALTATPASADDDAEKVGILAALGLTAADGKTELKDGGGATEGWLVAASAIEAAAATIVERAKPEAPAPSMLQNNDTVVLLQGNQPFDTLSYELARSRITAAAKMASAAQGSADCKPGPGIRGGRPATDVAAAIIGALKVSTTVQGYDVASADNALVTALSAALGRGGVRAILPDEIARTGGQSMLFKDYTALEESLLSLRLCTQSDDMKAKVGAIEGVTSDLAAPGKDGAPSLLSKALAAESIIAARAKVLRVKVEKAGGSIITRSNIFLQFGFPGALSITGGMVVSYRWIEPATGQVTGGGVLACRVAEQDMSAFLSVSRKVRKAPEAECTGPYFPKP